MTLTQGDPAALNPSPCRVTVGATSKSQQVLVGDRSTSQRIALFSPARASSLVKRVLASEPSRATRSAAGLGTTASAAAAAVHRQQDDHSSRSKRARHKQ